METENLKAIFATCCFYIFLLSFWFSYSFQNVTQEYVGLWLTR